MSQENTDIIEKTDSESIEARLAKLEQKLEEEGWEEKVDDVLYNVMQGQGLDYEVERGLKTFLDERDLAELIINVLGNNDPNYYQQLGFEVPQAVERFFKKITLKSGAAFQESISSYYGPDNWRKLTSEALVGEQYGARLRTRVLKWDGEIFELAGKLPQMVQAATHIIQNINNRFSNYDKQDARNMLLQLEELKDKIKQLEHSIPVETDDSED